MYKLFIAWRYMTRHWLNLLGILAVWMVVTALICVMSVMKAFDVQFRERIRGTLSDLILEPWPGLGSSFGGYDEIMAKVEALPEVTSCAPQYDGVGLLRTGNQAEPTYCEFHGIDLSREIKTTEFLDYWQTWRASEAVEELRTLFPITDDKKLAQPDPGKVFNLMTNIRRKDFESMDDLLREKIIEFLSQNKISVSDTISLAESARPDWGNIEDPRISPIIPGSNLLVLGKDMNEQLVKLDVGDKVVLISLPPDTTGDFEGRLLRNCRIVGAFHSGMYEFDGSTLYMPLQDVQKLMARTGEVTSIIVRLDTFDNATLARAKILGILTPDELSKAVKQLGRELKKSQPELIAKLKSQTELLAANASEWFAVGDYRAIAYPIEVESAILSAIREMELKSPVSKDLQTVKELIQQRDQNAISRKFQISTWEDKRRSFLRAVYIERRIMAFILVFVSLIAGFLVFAILHTTVLVKTKDIGIMKAIGGSVRGIQWIFTLNGLLIATIGSILGTVSALFITMNINEIEGFLSRVTGFTLWPGDIYYLDKIPVDKDPTETIVMVIVTVFVVSLLGSAYPANRAARMDAVEALRYE